MTSNEYAQAIQKLQSMDQETLLQGWNLLNSTQQHHLLHQIEALDIPLIQKMRLQLKEPLHHPEKISPFLDYEMSGNSEDKTNGLALIAQGRMGCLLVAGGQGTRLRMEGPKGIFPISIIKNKSLFQLFAEKVIAAGEQARCLLPVAIMTSPLNDEATKSFFISHDYFGLKPSQVSFFSQGMLPLLDQKGNLFLEDVDTLAEGPDGNGSSLKQFVSSGIWEQWYRQGIRYLNYILIDNPLADPFDSELLGFHVRQKSEITMKCTPKRNANEKVGVLVKKEGKVSVVEYSEMPDSERSATLDDGTLKHLCANLSLFCCDMDFIKDTMMKRYSEIPLHMAFKAAKYLKEDGKAVMSTEPISWKFERFIFDILPFAKKVSALLFPRNECFAPLKNFDGEDSPATVKAALQQRDQEIIKKITGLPAPNTPFELSQSFHYPTDKLIRAWKGKSIGSQQYIE